MNGITISLLFLIMISMVLPTSAIMYASGSTVNSDDASDSEFSEDSFASEGGSTDNSDSTSDTGSTDDNTDSSADTGSTDDNADLSTTSTENNPTLPSESPLGNNTENVQGDDLTSSILAVHNQERAAVGVQPLTWSDTLAAGAQTWAQHLATSGEFKHSPDTSYGENLAGFTLAEGVSAPGGGQSLWVDEKSNYVPGTPILENNFRNIGHYTQMVWKDTTQVGCGTATGNGHPFSILVCQYTPPGNRLGQLPY
jgi:uncharacterized protein YkwD